MNNNLASYTVMRRMYERDGLTYREIAGKLRVEHYTTVYAYLRREAKKRGDSWPLKPPAKRQLNDNTVRADLIVLEIREFCEREGWTIKQFALEMGVAPSWIWNFTCQTKWRKRMKRASADRIMSFIISCEERAA